MTKTRMHKNKTKAITLVELLVSIGVVVITLGMIATFIKFQEPRFALSAATHDLQTTLREARARTLTQQRQHQVRFIIATNQYELIDGQNPPVIIFSRTLPVTTEFYSVGPFANNTISFNTAGAATESGMVVIQNNQGKTKTVIINPSGFIGID